MLSIRYRSKIARSVHTTVKGLHRIGLVSEKTLYRFDSSCLKRKKGPASKKNRRAQSS